MAIDVRFFAILREAAGTDQLELSIEAPISAAEVFAQLKSKYPKLAPYRPIVSFAINGEYVTPETQVKDGDELAFIPPISGGANG